MALIRPLIITKVSYRTNVITPNEKYRSKHVEAEATVGDEDDPNAVLLSLAHWVHQQLGIERAPTSALRSLGDED